MCLHLQQREPMEVGSESNTENYCTRFFLSRRGVVVVLSQSSLDETQSATAAEARWNVLQSCACEHVCSSRVDARLIRLCARASA
jgi:hypothetical protein